MGRMPMLRVIFAILLFLPLEVVAAGVLFFWWRVLRSFCCLGTSGC